MGQFHGSNPMAHYPTYNPFTLLRMIGFFSSRNYRLSNIPRLSDKVAIVTGGQSGIGREITKQFLIHGITKVFVLGRSEDKYLAAKSEWAGKRGFESAKIEGRTEFLQCDLADINDVKKAADILIAKSSRLDIIVNNAGVTIPRDRSLSPQGVENTFAVNHLGHFTLTNLLLPLVEKTAKEFGDARIFNTSSCFHLVCQDIDMSLLTSSDNIKSPIVFDSVWRYGRSKLANILFARELAKQLEKKGASNIYVNSFFPGNIATDAWNEWQNHFGTAIGMMIKGIFRLIGQSLKDAATTAMFLTASPVVKERNLNGKYFIPIADESKPSITAENKDLATNLWYWSDNKVAETLGKGWRETADATPFEP